MKIIPLTQGKATLVDDEDFEFLNQFKWYAHKCRNTYYVQRGYKKEDGKLGNIHMHRIIMDIKNNKQIDHIDHNGLNNQKSNLRICNHKQNMRNSTGFGKSKFKGINLQRGKYFAAHISINGKTKHLGSFKTEIEAAKKYDEAAKMYYGEFANLNFKNI